MPISNVALTDTFDDWRKVTNQTVTALNDKILQFSTSNANIISITGDAYRQSNVYVNVATVSSITDQSTTNVANPRAVNAVANIAAAGFLHANLAYNTSNAGFLLVNTAFGFANTLNTYAYGTNANMVSNYDTTNVAYHTANGAFATANLGFQSANGGVVTGNVNFTGNVILSGANVHYTGGKVYMTANIASVVLTDAATINWNLSEGQVATITLGANRVVGAPTNLRIGSYILHVYQDGTGGRSLTWNSIFKWPAGVAPPVTTAAGSHDVFAFICDGTYLYGSFIPDVR